MGPSIMAYALNLNTWRLGYVIVGSMLIGISLIVLLSFQLWKKETQAERDTDHAHVHLKDILKTKGAIPSVLIFLIYVHMESLGGVWIASYFYITKSLSYAQAALFTTTFYLALTIGRLTSGFVSHRLSPKTLIQIGITLISISGLLMLFEYPFIWIYPMVVFLFGLGCAPIFPNMMFLNSKNFDQKKLSKIMSLQMGVGYMGFGILTPLAGMMFDLTDISIFPIIMIIMSSILFILLTRYFQQTNQKLPVSS